MLGGSNRISSTGCWREVMLPLISSIHLRQTSCHSMAHRCTIALSSLEKLEKETPPHGSPFPLASHMPAIPFVHQYFGNVLAMAIHLIGEMSALRHNVCGCWISWQQNSHPLQQGEIVNTSGQKEIEAEMQGELPIITTLSQCLRVLFRQVAENLWWTCRLTHAS